MEISRIFIPIVLLVILSGAVRGHGEEEHSDFSDVMTLMEDDVPCNELTDAQLERIGDYYMEQMHPGEAHIRMDQMMGGEGSESLEDAHINMAQRFYCGQEGPQTPQRIQHTNQVLIFALLIAIIGFGAVILRRR